MNTADAEIKVSSAENPELSEVFSSKPDAGQNIAVLASSAARNFPRSNLYFPGQFNFILPRSSHQFSLR